MKWTAATLAIIFAFAGIFTKDKDYIMLAGIFFIIAQNEFIAERPR